MRRGLLLMVLSTALAVGEARAAEPAAMVEEITASGASVRAFDYLQTGQAIELGKSGRLVVDYLRNCNRETIIGGAVTIGIDRSLVTGGTLSSERIECDGGGLRLTAEQAMNAGVIVVRKLQRPADSAFHVNVIIHSTAPLVDLGSPLVPEANGKLRLMVERLDAPGEPLTLELAPAQLKSGRLYDFAAAGRALEAGGVYRLSKGAVNLVVRIDAAAVAGAGPMLGRLVRL